jgi:hypothetical protein
MPAGGSAGCAASAAMDGIMKTALRRRAWERAASGMLRKPQAEIPPVRVRDGWCMADVSRPVRKYMYGLTACPRKALVASDGLRVADRRRPSVFRDVVRAPARATRVSPATVLMALRWCRSGTEAQRADGSRATRQHPIRAKRPPVALGAITGPAALFIYPSLIRPALTPRKARGDIAWIQQIGPGRWRRSPRSESLNVSHRGSSALRSTVM